MYKAAFKKYVAILQTEPVLFQQNDSRKIKDDSPVCFWRGNHDLENSKSGFHSLCLTSGKQATLIKVCLTKKEKKGRILLLSNDKLLQCFLLLSPSSPLLLSPQLGI